MYIFYIAHSKAKHSLLITGGCFSVAFISFDDIEFYYTCFVHNVLFAFNVFTVTEIDIETHGNGVAIVCTTSIDQCDTILSLACSCILLAKSTRTILDNGKPYFISGVCNAMQCLKFYQNEVTKLSGYKPTIYTLYSSVQKKGKSWRKFRNWSHTHKCIAHTKKREKMSSVLVNKC